MRGSGNEGASSHLVFSILAVLLIAISVLFLLASRMTPRSIDQGKVSPTKSTSKSTSMTISDKIIVPLTLMSMPLRGGEKMVEDLRARSDVSAENERLKARIEQLADAEMRANALAMKIKRFETLLSADVGIDIPLTKIAGRVVSENNGPFARSALLNVGAVSGVRVGYAVMTEQGLYGHVVAVGKRSSRVLLVQDINSRIAVMSQRSEARAIMVGTNKGNPNLSFVARDADWQDGDLVITSGDEGVLPRGLPIGTITQRAENKRDVNLYSIGNPVDWVWVYPFTPTVPPEQDPASEADLIDVEQTDAPAPTDISVQTEAIEGSGSDNPAAVVVERP